MVMVLMIFIKVIDPLVSSHADYYQDFDINFLIHVMLSVQIDDEGKMIRESETVHLVSVYAYVVN